MLAALMIRPAAAFHFRYRASSTCLSARYRIAMHQSSKADPWAGGDKARLIFETAVFRPPSLRTSAVSSGK